MDLIERLKDYGIEIEAGPIGPVDAFGTPYTTMWYGIPKEEGLPKPEPTGDLFSTYLEWLDGRTKIYQRIPYSEEDGESYWRITAY